jgi:WD40 repeat protein
VELTEVTYAGRTRPFPRLGWALVLLVILALAAAVLMAGGISLRRLPHFGAAANGALAYVDGGTLKLASADGSTVKAAASIPAGAESLAFSPDGTHLAYRTSGTTPSIVVADADGSRPVVATGTLSAAAGDQIGVASPFAFLPDNRRIAFTAVSQTGLRSIVIADLDGSKVVQLKPDGAAAADTWFNPAASPDGQWIAFFWHRAATPLTAIYVVHPDGSGGQVLPNFAVDRGSPQIDWSPDPSQPRLAYTGGGDAGNIQIRDMATSREASAGCGIAISWSPDGKRVAWWNDDPTDCRTDDPQVRSDNGIEIALVDDVIAGRTQVVHPLGGLFYGTCAGHENLAGKAICGPAYWSPDSRLLAGTDVTGTSIVVAAIDGSAPLRTLALDHPIDFTAGPYGSLAWQAVAP